MLLFAQISSHAVRASSRGGYTATREVNSWIRSLFCKVLPRHFQCSHSSAPLHPDAGKLCNPNICPMYLLASCHVTFSFLAVCNRLKCRGRQLFFAPHTHRRAVASIGDYSVVLVLKLGEKKASVSVTRRHWS